MYIRYTVECLAQRKDSVVRVVVSVKLRPGEEDKSLCLKVKGRGG